MKQVMLAHKYREDLLVFPVHVQPKMDGIRCRVIFDPKEKTLLLRSRDDKPIEGFYFIRMYLLEMLLHLQEPTELDGELYSETLPFETLSGVVRSGTRDSSQEDEIHLVLYDVIQNTPYTNRLQFLRGLSYPSSFVRLVESHVAHTVDEINEHHSRFLRRGLEGTMVRMDQVLTGRGKKRTVQEVGYQSESLTGHRRSYSLLKLKDFQDAEFEVIGVEEEYDILGNPKGRTGALQMRTNAGLEFCCSGLTAELKESSWRNPESVIGKMATVKFFEETNAGIPRFPSFLRFREE